MVLEVFFIVTKENKYTLLQENNLIAINLKIKKKQLTIILIEVD